MEYISVVDSVRYSAKERKNKRKTGLPRFAGVKMVRKSKKLLRAQFWVKI